MKLILLLAILGLFTVTARADWVYEFELDYGLPGYTDRLLMPDCGSVVPVRYIPLYLQDPRPGWTIACGNNQPMYTHFLGRQIGHPLPNLIMELGWRHLSSPNDSREITFDALALRGRFTFGKRRD